MMKKLSMLLLIFSIVTCLGQPPGINPEKMEIYVSPFYDSASLNIQVGKYSEGLASTQSNVFLKTIKKMKEHWSELSVEELYVGAIRLYDQEYRDESVYWFYVAFFRSKVLNGILDQSKVEGPGSPAFELMSAQGSFFQLIGTYINGYGFGNLEKVITIIRKAREDGANVPNMEDIYPKLPLISETERKAVIEDVVNDMTAFIEFIEREKVMLKEKRVESGMDKKFRNLANKDLPKDIR